MNEYANIKLERIAPEYPELTEEEILGAIRRDVGEDTVPDVPQNEGLEHDGRIYYREDGWWGHKCWRGAFMTVYSHTSQIHLDLQHLQHLQREKSLLV